MTRLTEDVHALLAAELTAGDFVIDATVGNGHDTLRLAELVGEGGFVLGFDVQAQALEAASARLGALISRVQLVQACHSEVGAYAPQDRELAAVVFNLGYLPGAPRGVTTRAVTSVAAIASCVPRMRSGAMLSVLAYTGHAGGAEEAAAVEAAMDAEPQLVWQRRDAAIAARPRVFVARKRPLSSAASSA